MNLVQGVRRNCERVCCDLQLLTVNYDSLAVYASRLPRRTDSTDKRAPGFDGSAEELERQRLRILSLDTINFGSGWHDVVSKRPGLSGARSMAAGLSQFEASHGALSASVLKSFDPPMCAEVFGQDLNNEELAELMTLFSQALGQLADLLSHHGSAGRLIDMCEFSAVRLAEELASLESFADVGFYKRAQIAAADLARNGLAEFADLGELTAFADNLVPHVLSQDEVITLDPDLARTISQGQLLEPGGQPETELRASAVHVVEMLTMYRPDLRAMDVDLALWERGGSRAYKEHRRPRCRSRYY